MSALIIFVVTNVDELEFFGKKPIASLHHCSRHHNCKYETHSQDFARGKRLNIALFRCGNKKVTISEKYTQNKNILLLLLISGCRHYECEYCTENPGY